MTPSTPTGDRRSGLSLVELLTTVVIMSILATAAIPLGEVVFIRDKETDLKRALYSTRQAIDRFHADTGLYPVDFDELRWFWKTNRPYLRQCPPINPLVNSHEAWICVLRSNIDKDEKLTEYESEIPLREKKLHARYLAYGIFDIKTPSPFRKGTDPDLTHYGSGPYDLKRGYPFVNPSTGAITYHGYYASSTDETFVRALDGTYYHEW